MKNLFYLTRNLAAVIKKKFIHKKNCEFDYFIFHFHHLTTEIFRFYRILLKNSKKLNMVEIQKYFEKLIEG